MKTLTAVIMTLVVGFAAPAIAGDDPNLYRLALGPTTVRGGYVPSIDDSFAEQLDGIQDCAAGIKAWQAPVAAGWVASFQVISTEDGRFHEFAWNKGHALPAKVRRCVSQQVRQMEFPTFAGRGYFAVQQVLLVLPSTTEVAPVRSTIAHQVIPLEDIQRAAAPHLYDIDECMLYRPDSPDATKVPGVIEFWFSVDSTGVVRSRAVKGVSPAWLTRANCVGDSLAMMEFGHIDDPDVLRLGQVIVVQANLEYPARWHEQRRLGGHQRTEVRMPQLLDPSVAASCLSR